MNVGNGYPKAYLVGVKLGMHLADVHQITVFLLHR